MMKKKKILLVENEHILQVQNKKKKNNNWEKGKDKKINKLKNTMQTIFLFLPSHVQRLCYSFAEFRCSVSR